MSNVAKLLYSASSSEAWSRKRAEIMRRVLSLAGKPPVRRGPPAPEVVEEVDCGSYVRRKIAYAVGPDERIPAFVLVPHRIKDPVPAILCLHGTTTEGKNFPVGISNVLPGRDYGHRLARRGYVAFCIDDPVMGERAKGVA